MRETDTLGRVRQGEAIVMAGLMQDRAGVATATSRENRRLDEARALAAKTR